MKERNKLLKRHLRQRQLRKTSKLKMEKNQLKMEKNQLKMEKNQLKMENDRIKKRI
jgi:hypothetical protein